MTQSKITTEAEAGKLLRRMAVHGWITVLESPATRWLVRRGYAYWGEGAGAKLYMTLPRYDRDDNRMPGPMTGREYFEGLCKNPAVTESAAAWKEEARSGMRVESGRIGTVTRQSDIDRAVIPKPAGPRTPKTPESILDRMQRDMAATVRWAERLGVTPDELHALGMEGRIKTCNGCGEVGIFDRHSRDGVQSRCRKCRKEGRGRA